LGAQSVSLQVTPSYWTSLSSVKEDLLSDNCDFLLFLEIEQLPKRNGFVDKRQRERVEALKSGVGDVGDRNDIVVVFYVKRD
jgi:hypothetical protein